MKLQLQMWFAGLTMGVEMRARARRVAKRTRPGSIARRKRTDA